MQNRANDGTYGLLAWLNETRIRLPLRGLDLRFEVNDTVADVAIDQVFVNDRPESVDVTYTFPLPAAAAVYRCEMIVDGRVTVAVVEEENLARRQFLEAKAAGQHAALVEQHRDNVFSLQLGNVPGRAVVVLRLSYLQELERLVETVSLRIPTCPGERYIPGNPLLRGNRGPGTSDDTDEVPDASLLSPPRIDGLHPDAAQVSLRGRMAAGEVDVRSIVSPSHPLVSREKGETVEISLALDSALPDQDFLIRWKPRPLAPDTSVATLASYLDSHAALCRLRGPEVVNESREPREVWFLLDRSGSMEGRKWEQSCLALHEALAGLRDEDRVGITFFETGVRHYSDRSETVAHLRSESALRSIVKLGVAGGTELLPALAAVVSRWSQVPAVATERHLILVTDGQVGNDEAVVAAARLFPANLRIHTLGIDQAVNDAVLLKLARNSSGRCVFVHPNESIVEAVSALVHAIEPPAVHHVTAQAPWKYAGTGPIALASRGERSLLVQAEQASPEVRWSGKIEPAGTWTPRAIHRHARSPAIVLLQARREIDQLQEQGLFANALVLAKRFNLLCKGACFIAIDRNSKVTVAQRHLYQPAVGDLMHPVQAFSRVGGQATEMMAGASESFPSLGRAQKKSSSWFGASPAAPVPAPDEFFAAMREASFLHPTGRFRDWLVDLRARVNTPAARFLVDSLLALTNSFPEIGQIELMAPSHLKVTQQVLKLFLHLEISTGSPSLNTAGLADALRALRGPAGCSPEFEALLRPILEIGSAAPTALAGDSKATV